MWTKRKVDPFDLSDSTPFKISMQTSVKFLYLGNTLPVFTSSRYVRVEESSSICSADTHFESCTQIAAVTALPTIAFKEIQSKHRMLC